MDRCPTGVMKVRSWKKNVTLHAETCVMKGSGKSPHLEGGEEGVKSKEPSWVQATIWVQ